MDPKTITVSADNGVSTVYSITDKAYGFLAPIARQCVTEHFQYIQ